MIDQSFGRAILEAADRRAQQIAEALVPTWRYGTVQALDAANRKATVTIGGQNDPGYAYSADQALRVGDLVRVVKLPTGDRYVDAHYPADATHLYHEFIPPNAADTLTNLSLHSVDRNSANVLAAPFAGLSDIWIEDFLWGSHVVSPNDGSNFWTVTLRKISTAGTATNLASPTTASDTVATRTQHVTPLGVLLGTNITDISVNVIKTGSPGGITLFPAITYRRVGP